MMVVKMTTPTDRWPSGLALPAAPLHTWRSHGNLDEVIDSERRALRPIGTTTHEIALLTSKLLGELLKLPSVRIFHGIRLDEANRPCIPHAIIAGRQLILVDSVAWPPGEYATMPTGQIYCDGRYIGQSVLPMINAVRFWRGFLPTGHQVTGLIVIHPTPDAGPAPTPPAPTSADLFWSRADEAVRDLGGRLPPGQQPVSLQALNALVAATSEEGNR
jgi:hypothetical protein